MNDAIRFGLRGSISPLQGPGFATPTFQRELGNGLWIQDIDESGRVAQFAELGFNLLDHNVTLFSELEQFVGQKAIYVFHGSERSYIDTREALEEPLRYEFENLVGLPYLRRSIGKFVNDSTLIERAEEELSRSNSMILNSAFPTWNELKKIIVADGHFEFAMDQIIRGSNLVVTGRRGSGKTTLLRWLENNLRNDKRVELLPIMRPGTLIQSFLNCGSQLPIWQELASRHFEARKVLVQRGKPTGELDRKIFFDFVSSIDEMRSRNECGRVILMIDDAHLVLNDMSDGRNSEAELFQEVLLTARGLDSIGLVLATPTLGIFGKVSHPFQLMHDFQSIELGDLDREQTRQFLERLMPNRDDLADLELLSLSNNFHGLNFRELTTIIEYYLRSSNRGEDSVRAAMESFCERQLAQQPAHAEEAGAILAAVDSGHARISSDNQLSDFGGIIIREELIHQLAIDGLLRVRENGQIEFRHRIIRDWWRSRRKAN